MQGDVISILLAQTNAPPPDTFGTLVFPLIIVVVFIYFGIVRPQKKEREEKEKLLGGLKKNDRVVTTGGMFGTVVNIKDDEVTLRVDDQAKVKIRFLKSAIARIVGPDTSPEAGEEQKKS